MKTCHHTVKDDLEVNSQSALTKAKQGFEDKWGRGGREGKAWRRLCRCGDGEVSVSQSALSQLWTPILHVSHPLFSLHSERQWWILNNEEEEKDYWGVMLLPWPIILLTLLPFHHHHRGVFMPNSTLQEDTFVNLFTFLPSPAVELLVTLLFLRFYFLSSPYFLSLCSLYIGIAMHCHIFVIIDFSFQTNVDFSEWLLILTHHFKAKMRNEIFGSLFLFMPV